jgi:cyclopropane-fatty-acyl-phospholipid synthase
MASLQQIGSAYNYLDELFRLSIGENADFTAAMYNGNLNLTLEEAQKQKHQYIYDNLNIQKGQKVLDIGCGWGPFLNFLRTKNVEGRGITLSTKQAETCLRHQFKVEVKDWKELTVNTFGTFDAVVSVGAFEHFCSKEEFLAGKQDEIYQNFFRLCADLLPSGGRLFIQTQMYGKNNVKDHTQISVDAPRDSPEFLIALVEKFYPGSWLPYGEEQIIRNAAPYFKVISLNNGRLDYLETIRQWRKRLYQFNLLKYLKIMGLAKFWLTDPDFRFRMRMVKVAAHKRCLEQEIFDHQRIVFEKL